MLFSPLTPVWEDYSVECNGVIFDNVQQTLEVIYNRHLSDMYERKKPSLEFQICVAIVQHNKFNELSYLDRVVLAAFEKKPGWNLSKDLSE